MVVHAGREAALPVRLHGVGRYGDDGQLRITRVAAQQARGRLAVHDGHLHVHEHGVVVLALDMVDGLIPATSCRQIKALESTER